MLSCKLIKCLKLGDLVILRCDGFRIKYKVLMLIFFNTSAIVKLYFRIIVANHLNPLV